MILTSQISQSELLISLSLSLSLPFLRPSPFIASLYIILKSTFTCFSIMFSYTIEADDEGLDPEIELEMEAFIDEIEEHLMMRDFDPDLDHSQQ